MKDYFVIAQIFVSLILVSLILLQAKGTGLGKSFGGRSNFFSTKRGVEKIIFNLTILISVIFIASSIIQTLIFPK